MISKIALYSDWLDFINSFLAGILKNKSSTVTVVPAGVPVSCNEITFPPSIFISLPKLSPESLDFKVTFETEAMLESASPLKP